MSGIDALRRKMIEAGLSGEDAAIACGLSADYAEQAYKDGYDKAWSRGYDAGFAKARKPTMDSAKASANPQLAEAS